MKLTVKQESFCQEYVKNGNATRSYQTVYSKGMSKAACHTEAQLMMKLPKIISRIDELQEQAVKATMLTVNQRLAYLLEAVEMAKNASQPKAIVSAVNEMNKMLGGHAAQVVQQSGELKLVTLETVNNGRGVTAVKEEVEDESED